MYHCLSFHSVLLILLPVNLVTLSVDHCLNNFKVCILYWSRADKQGCDGSRFMVKGLSRPYACDPFASKPHTYPGCHVTLSRVPCAIGQILVGYPFQTSRCVQTPSFRLVTVSLFSKSVLNGLNCLSFVHAFQVTFSPKNHLVHSFPGGSAGKKSACNEGDLGSIPGWERSPGEGKGYPLQYSGLENSVDCIVHGVTKIRT